MRPTIFVCKLNDKYIRFESYGSLVLVDFPEQGTIYRRKQDAIGKTKRFDYHLDGKTIKAKQLTVVSILFSDKHTEQLI